MRTVLGSRFAFEHLCSVAALPEHAAAVALDTLVHTGMLREEATGHYSFSYSALQAAIDAQVGTARRHVFTKRAQALHGAAQVTIAAEPPRVPVSGGQGAVATHMAWQLTDRHEQPPSDRQGVPVVTCDDEIRPAVFQPHSRERIPLAR